MAAITGQGEDAITDLAIRTRSSWRLSLATHASSLCHPIPSQVRAAALAGMCLPFDKTGSGLGKIDLGISRSSSAATRQAEI